MAYFEKLKRDYPDLVETWIAQEAFPEILPPAYGGKAWAHCGTEPCRTLIVRIANKRRLEDKEEALSRPEVFFSGALHGDERLGPLVVTELAGFLCSQYQAGHPEVRRLVDTRNTWIMPMTNAYGYAHHVRHENGMDPNRDFPYLQKPTRCMMTQTSRSVNELFRRHLFQYTLTFHGGMRALTYEWGSYNHLRSGRSTESPDDYAFTEVGRQIRAASGTDRSRHSWYPFGRINDLVYPVDGGLEDWSYAAGFERAPSPITPCRPTTYGGYDVSRTSYREGSVATLVYLAEMDDDKTPKSGTLGSAAQIWGMDAGQGHVARNLRMCLKLIELTKPEVVIEPPRWPEAWTPESDIGLALHGFGCVTLSAARFLLVRRDQVRDCGSLAPVSTEKGARAELLASAVKLAEMPVAVPCRGMSVWEELPQGASVQLLGRLPAGMQGEFCAAVAAEFDQTWGQQSHPDPALRPRAHAARLRLEEHYTMAATDPLDSSGERMRLDEYRTKLFSVQATPLVLQPGVGAGGTGTGAIAARAGPQLLPTPGPAVPLPAAPVSSVGIVALPPAEPAGGSPAGSGQADGAGGGLAATFADIRLYLAVALLAGAAVACHAAGLRCSSSGCRRLPTLFSSSVIGRQAGPDEAEQMEGGVE